MPVVERMRPLLGTFVAIRAGAAHGAGRAQLEAALESAFGAVARVHRLMSAHEPESDVARINRARPCEPIVVDPWTWTVLRHARELSEATAGLFDCCVAPRLQASGKLPRFESDTAADPDARYDDLEFLPGHALRLRRPLHVTLDGIAKGFAVDCAVATLRRRGVRSGAVNAGGDLRVFGPVPEPVHLRHPADPGRLVRLGALREAAVATSALYFSGDASTIVNPRTGRECRSRASATVIARDCMTADALAKPLLIDPSAARPALVRLGARGLHLACARAAA